MSKPNQVLENAVLDTTFSIAKGKGLELIKIGAFRIKDKDGDGYNVMDIIREAQDVQAGIDTMEGKSKTFAEHLMLLAGTCATPEIFESLMATACLSARIGRKPKGLTNKEIALWKTMPQTLQDYKHRILKAWKEGIIPGKTYKILEGKKGQEKLVSKSASSPNVMAKIARFKKAEKEATDPATVRGAQAGIDVHTDGELEQKIPPVATEAQEDLKTMAACVSLDLVGLLSRTVELYDLSDDKEKQTVINTIENLNKRLEKKVAKQVQAEAA